jgi:hypothetical protein
MKNENIEQRIEETIESLNGLQCAEANSFLYTKIEQRLRTPKLTNTYEKSFYKLSFALILFIVLNVFTYSKFYGNTTKEGAAKTGIEAFATEYGLQQTRENI